MLEAIPDPEQTTTDADIELQLQEALVSTIAADIIDPSLDLYKIDLEQEADYIVLQADFIKLDIE
jgi:hypothetical protein